MPYSELPPHTASGSRATVDGVVALEPVGQFFRVFTRSESGVTFRDHPFHPFVLLADPALADAVPVATRRHHLQGSGGLSWLVQLDSWRDWCQLREHLQQLNRPAVWFAFPESSQQFLVASGITCFKGLEPRDLKVLCIAVSVDRADMQMPRHDPCGNAAITAIAVSNGTDFEAVISADQLTEPELLRRLTMIIQEQDPDVITGYQLSEDELPCLVSRARRHGVRLEWGRNGTEPYQQHMPEHHAGRPRFEVYGRTVLDTRALVRQYDRQVQPLPGSGLRQVATWFGCNTSFATDQQPLRSAVRETVALYQLLIPYWYRQVQLYPVSLQGLLSRTSAAAVNALLVREYLFRQHAVPAPATQRKAAEYNGSQMLRRGRLGPVVHCELSALAAAIMLAYRIAPHGDELGVFPTALRSVLQLCSEQPERLLGKQKHAACRLLLPAWSELLARGQYPFSDPVAAGELERLRNVLVRDLLDWLREQGAEPVAADLQGIYFMPPAGHDGDDEIDMLIQRLAGILPCGADLYCSGRYQAMLVYKQNNYALLEQGGEMVVRGSSFVSRAMEPFLREFLLEAVRLVLVGQGEQVCRLYEAFLRRLTDHTCPVSWVTRSETVLDTRENYLQAVQSGKRNRAAVYELALAGPGAWRVGDKIRYYVSGHAKNVIVHESCRLVADFDPAHPDLNIPWYAERLHQLFRRLEPFLPAEPSLFG
ncbi:hypothetical protein FY034_01705 [Trichlorobacter lovleyi]|uniref:hypothetical protein n=1 Tax=Trichlorobacter lovleyi TaxID=313985 RepID=UPI00223E993D|nr:hypothetical protein [Trichlorobacter lovleyi]QOX77703.1 hypothetical protein FY034_01705 [Trichlorobacter lovleyi]